MAANDVKLYLKKVEAQLELPRALKRRLLVEIRHELEEQRTDPSEWDDPDVVAAMLQSSVSPAIVSAYRSRRRSKQWMLVGTLVVLLTLSIALFVHAEKTQISRIEQEVVEVTDNVGAE